MPKDAGLGPAGSGWRRQGGAPHGRLPLGNPRQTRPSLPAAREEAGDGEGRAGTERRGWCPGQVARRARRRRPRRSGQGQTRLPGCGVAAGPPLWRIRLRRSRGGK